MRTPRFRRYVLRELDARGPLLSREIEDHVSMNRDAHDWWGVRKMGLMLEVLAGRGEVAVVGRRGKQRLWDLAERWYPETERVSWRDAQAAQAEKRFRALGVKLERGRLLVHPDAADGTVPPRRVVFLSPFDRLIHDRARTETLWDFYYRLEMYVPKPKREYGYYVLPILRGDTLIGRIEPVHDRKAGILRVNGVWWEDGVKPVSLAAPLTQPRPLPRRRLGARHLEPLRWLAPKVGAKMAPRAAESSIAGWFLQSLPTFLESAKTALVSAESGPRRQRGLGLLLRDRRGSGLYLDAVGDERNTGDPVPADQSQPSPEERRAALLRQLSEQTFADLFSATLREPRYPEQER